jgi:histidinol-phosphate aminotransferase
VICGTHERCGASGSIVNPHAPTGVLADADTIADIANEFRGVLLVDEAYVDFVEPALRHDTINMVRAFDNVLLLRTLSKGYSLAGSALATESARQI